MTSFMYTYFRDSFAYLSNLAFDCSLQSKREYERQVADEEEKELRTFQVHFLSIVTFSVDISLATI